MEMEYIPIKSDGGTIVHFTRSVESLISILRSGFVYTVNPTRIWEKLFKDIGLANIPDIEHGMVCFSEVPEGVDRVTGHFGEYGIAVDFNWALDNGLKKVAYISDDGPVYESFKTLLQESKKDLPDYGKIAGDERTGRILQEMLLCNPYTPASFTTPLYALIIEMFQWIETDANISENEWRIRSFKKIGGLGDFSKEEQVSLSLGMKNNILPLPKENILYLKCPEGQQEEFKKKITGNGFGDIKIIFY